MSGKEELLRALVKTPVEPWKPCYRPRSMFLRMAQETRLWDETRPVQGAAVFFRVGNPPDGPVWVVGWHVSQDGCAEYWHLGGTEEEAVLEAWRDENGGE